MRATDLVRLRRERARQASRRGRRVSRFLVAAVLLVLLASVLAPLLAVVAGTVGLLAFTTGLPDVAALEQIPDRTQPSTTATYLYAWDKPAADGSRQAVIIDTIIDPRVGATWVQVDHLPRPISSAFFSALDPVFGRAATPSLFAELQDWWLSGAIPTAQSPLTAGLIRDHLRDESTSDTTRQAWQDWFLARQIDGRYSREQQLEWALNTAYFGNLAYGIDAAARLYFGKGATELTTAEATLLAATARNPAQNPFDDLDVAREAQAAILQDMVNRGILPSDEAEAVLSTPPPLAALPGSDALAPAFARLARRELERILGPERLLAGGWQVETTLDLALQGQVECLLAANSGTGGGPPCPAREYLAGTIVEDSPTAVVAIHPATGSLQAVAGDATVPHPTGTLAQTLVYLTALSQGHTAATLTLDVPSIYLQDGRPYSPRNPDGDFLGPLRLREAMAAARAVPATQALSWVGVSQVLATGRAMGLDSGPTTPDLTFPTTGFPASLLDLGRAFAAIGNGGRMAGVTLDDGMPRPATIQRVVGGDGRELYAYSPATRETLSPELAYLVTDILSDAEARCPAGGCSDWPALPGGQRAAVVTGEAADNTWALGYTPDTLIGVVARDSHTGDDTAGDGAADIWRSLMAWTAKDQPVTTWPQPGGLRSVDVCAISGLLPSREADCPTVSEWFVPGTEPSAVDDMVREVAVNRETGRLATIFTPPHLIERRTYIVYPLEAAGWAEATGVEQPPTEYDTIRRIPTRDGAAELAVEPWTVLGRQESPGRQELPWSVTGSAGGEDFSYYRLAYFPGLLPEAMQTLVARGESPVDAAELGVWDTSLVEDGLYTLLLTVVREDGTFDEVAVPVRVGDE